jgi:prophage antirepressor-like protein
MDRDADGSEGDSDSDSDDGGGYEVTRMNDVTARTTVCEGTLLVSAVDVVRMVTRRSSRDYAGQVLRRIVQRTPALTQTMTMVTQSSGGRAVAFCDATTASKILMLCPGEAAHDVRAAYAECILRHIRGDATLVEEIIRRNASAAELPEPLRRFLGCTPHHADTLANISDFALETVSRIGEISDLAHDVRSAQIDDSGRLTCLVTEQESLLMRVDALHSRLSTLEAAFDCFRLSSGRM